MGAPATAALVSSRSRLDHPLLLWAIALVLIVGGALAFALWPERGGAAGEGDVQVIARGEIVQVDSHLVAGKYTLIDFYADWCPNCRRLNPLLEDLAGRRPNLAIRKVNVVSWDSPVAKQYAITALPRLILYGPQGDFIAEGDVALAQLDRLFG